MLLLSRLALPWDLPLATSFLRDLSPGDCFSLDLSKFTCILGREGGTCDPQFYKEEFPEQEIIVQVHSHLHPRGGVAADLLKGKF